MCFTAHTVQLIGARLSFRAKHARVTHAAVLSDTASRLYVSFPSFVVYEHGPTARTEGRMNASRIMMRLGSWCASCSVTYT